MTEAEQWAFWSTMNADLIRRLADNEARHDFQFRGIHQKLDLVLARTSAIESDLRAQPSSLAISQVSGERLEMPTAALSMTTLCWLHRILTEGLGAPEAVRGRFRSIQVWIGEPSSTSNTASYVPPPSENILDLTSEFLAWWQQRHAELRMAAKPEIIAGLAELHHRFLQIHPFLDGNGRVARCLLDQAARELLNQSVGREFTKNPIEYYSALRKADEGDLAPLRHRIMASLE
jgi:Fic family protein